MIDFASRRVTMVDTQVRPSDVTKFPIIAAMLAVRREIYMPDARREAAYVGEDVDLGDGRVVLQARTLAKLLDALDLQPTELVLDLGCGYGYSSAVIAQLAEAVIAVEADETIAAEAQRRLAVEGVDNAVVIQGPLDRGAAKHGPYDAVILQGGVEVVPDAILAQLREGGRIAAIFMTGPLGKAMIGYKFDGRVTWRFSFNATAPVISGFAAPRGFVL
jgi:protein-L-isoaspartate(D-aspartate) O-methyltransferase